MASQDVKSDPTPKSTAAWRESCIKAIIPQVMLLEEFYIM